MASKTSSTEKAFLNIRKAPSKKAKIRTQEQKDSLFIEVSGIAPGEVSARIEGDYLCVREKRSGFAKVIPGKVVQKVFLPEDVSIDSITAKHSAGILHCRLTKKH